VFVNSQFFQFYFFQNVILQVEQVFLNSQFSKTKKSIQLFDILINSKKLTLIRLSPNSSTRKLTNVERFSIVRI